MLRTVVVGLGRIGWQFHLPEIDRHEGYTLTGVVDPLAERRDEALARYGAPAHDNLRDSLEQVEADLVVLALPTTLHAEQAEVAFAAGCDVFCDKPMAPDLQAADRMIAAAEQYGRRLMVYQPERGGREVVCHRMAWRRPIGVMAAVRSCHGRRRPSTSPISRAMTCVSASASGPMGRSTTTKGGIWMTSR